MPPDRAIQQLCAELSICPAGGESRTLDDRVVRTLLPSLRPPEPHCLGDPPIYWDEPLLKQEVPQVTTCVSSALRILRLAIPKSGCRFTCPEAHRLMDPDSMPYLATAQVMVPSADGLWFTLEAAGATEALALSAAAVRAVGYVRAQQGVVAS